MLGLPRGEVFLVPWSIELTKEFESEKRKIIGDIGQYIINVHHIGSTAVKGLSAKPIIDIAIEIEHFFDGEKCVIALEALGYSYKGTNVLPERHYFNKGEPRTHQIHMYQRHNKYLLEQLNFRDYLRNNEQARSEYQQLKLKLSRLHGNDKHKYAHEKTDFIKSILEKI
ncbi:GrpB family protein [Bacillus altitudinis]|uniref:GrpB family protein n=1 Tax=Bacillus altitudinis TaxID=293387 RepID=UPI00227E7761|nr:GrpB family protein [Bacillus altitudinis]MCY7450003.1 GrpB family protein [Bacillus altitudinis]